MIRGLGRIGSSAATLLAVMVATVTPASAYTPNDPYFTKGDQWNMQAINAPKAWDTATGRGTTIAVVDTGIDLQHEDLAAKIDTADAWNFVAGTNDVQDDKGHGTHVSGIAAAITNNGKGVVGVAPDARIMPIKVLDSSGLGNEAVVEDGIRWAADHHATVINLSLGDPASQSFAGVTITNGSDFDAAVQYAWSKGSIVVVAAGNNFVTSSAFSTEPALVVAATGRNNSRPTYSSSVGAAQWGISAPGGSGEEAPVTANADDVLSTYWDGAQPNEYAYDAGTSMAAPHVAGAAAVLRSMGFSPQQTVSRLLQTATPLGASSVYGAGLLNLGAAVATPPPSSGPGAAPPPAVAAATAAATPTRAGTAPAATTAGATRLPASPPVTTSPAVNTQTTAAPAGAAALGPADLATKAPTAATAGSHSHGAAGRPWVWAAVAATGLAGVTISLAAASSAARRTAMPAASRGRR